MKGLSIVIPSYNSAKWLPKTLSSLDTALKYFDQPCEIVVVDDGSTDNTGVIISEFSQDSRYEVKLITQTNQGRFLARWAGILQSKYDKVMLLDSRVVIAHDSLAYIGKQIEESNEELLWQAYVETSRQSAVPGHFWDLPTRMFWGKFLRNPIKVRFGLIDFDKYPKGTGCIIVKKQSLMEAIKKVWPEGNADLVSDDTKLLRELISTTDMILDPNFYATYIPRDDYVAFIRHTFNRGTLFVDSYAGTSLIRRVLIILMVAVPLILVFNLLTPLWFLSTLALLMYIAIPAFIGIVNKTRPKPLFSYILLCIPFGVLFWGGLCRGIVVHRNHFYFFRGLS